MTEENGKRLTPAQREQLLAWIAEGLDSDEINERAREQDPPWTVARSTVSHYRKTRGIDRDQLRQQAEQAAIATGYATAAERIQKMSELAGQLEQDLTTNRRLWLRRKKGIGFGRNSQVVEEDEFNEAEIRQYRGLLDDIARELGQRRNTLDVDQETTILWDLPIPGWTPAAEPITPPAPSSRLDELSD